MATVLLSVFEGTNLIVSTLSPFSKMLEVWLMVYDISFPRLLMVIVPGSVTDVLEDVNVM